MTSPSLSFIFPVFPIHSLLTSHFILVHHSTRIPWTVLVSLSFGAIFDGIVMSTATPSNVYKACTRSYDSSVNPLLKTVYSPLTRVSGLVSSPFRHTWARCRRCVYRGVVVREVRRFLGSMCRCFTLCFSFSMM